MFKENVKLKLIKREINTPGLIHNKNAKIFIDKSKGLKNKNRPQTKDIFGKKGNNDKNKPILPLHINNKNNLININNINNIGVVDNKKYKLKNFKAPINFNKIDFNLKKRLIAESQERKFHNRLSQGNNHNINQNNNAKNNLIINNNMIINNNNVNQLSKSLKKKENVPNSQNKFYNLIEENLKNDNKIFLQKNAKNENINNNIINREFPLLKNDSNQKIKFSEQEDFKPDNNINQLKLLKIKKEFDIKKNIHINPLINNKMNGFINNNFKNYKKKVLVGFEDKKHRNNNNLINMNLNINKNGLNENKIYFLKNNDAQINNRKNNLINDRENRFFLNRGNHNINNDINWKNNHIKPVIKSIDELNNRKHFKNNLIEKNINNKNNIIIRQAILSNEEPIRKKENEKFVLRHAKIDINKQENKLNNLRVIKPKENNNESHSKIIDYCSKENINSKFNDKMEDYTLIKHPFFSLGRNNLSIFAVFDGHGGEEVAKFLKENYSQNLEKTIKSNLTSRLTDILRNSIKNIDKDIEKIENSKNCGSTGTFVLVNNNNIYCANVGDSKCFYINDNEAIQLTEDHNCKNEKEVEMLRKKGVSIFRQRVYGSLSLTRSFGDMEYKVDGITAEPFIKKIFVDKHKVKYIVIASDGIWDLVDGKILYKISKELKKGTCEEFCNNLVNYALENGSKDNISCIIIKF